MNAEELIALLGLQPLPREGGYYRETYRAARTPPAQGGCGPRGGYVASCPGTDVAQGGLVVFRRVEVAQRLEGGIDVGQFGRLDDAGGDGLEEEERPQPVLGQQAADGVGDAEAVDGRE